MADSTRSAVVKTLALGAMFVFAVPLFGLFGFAVSLIFDLLFAWPLMLAWNYVMPAVFKLAEVTYWQSFSLIVVFQLLVKSQSFNYNQK